MIKEGDKAPAFDLESDEGGKVALRDYADRTLVLYFYPRDNTPGCTRQAQAFTAQKKVIEAAGASVVGVSRDSLKSHVSFRQKCGLGITLLSDPDLSVHKAYGAWGTKTMYGKKIEGVLRSTFVIANGKVTRVFPNVKVDGHADAVLRAIDSGSSSSLSNTGENNMAAKKKASKKKSEPSLGDVAGDLVAKGLSKVAKALAPKKGKAKKAASKVKKAAKKVAKKATSTAKKAAGSVKKAAKKVTKKKKSAKK